MALYVLVRRDGVWWLAAGQNTPVRLGPPIDTARSPRHQLRQNVDR